ncbi:hypothetical protein PL81_15660, partial [Streptomyces sp. RSD-27]
MCSSSHPVRIAVAGADPLGVARAAGAEVHPDLGALCAAPEAGGPVPDAVVVEFPAGAAGAGAATGGAPEAVRETLARGLDLLHSWLAQDARYDATRLVVLTPGAVAMPSVPGQTLPGPASAGRTY